MMPGKTRIPDIAVETLIQAPLDTVWRALTNSILAAEWLGARPEQADTNGASRAENSFQIIDVVPKTRVVYRWREADDDNISSRVTVEIASEGPVATRLRLVHQPPMRLVPRAANQNAGTRARAA
ncbi:MAG: SRPBCC domain-containing protein [Nitratireductor sp.]